MKQNRINYEHLLWVAALALVFIFAYYQGRDYGYKEAKADTQKELQTCYTKLLDNELDIANFKDLLNSELHPDNE